MKNNSDMLDTLLNTLIRQIKLQPEVAKTVAKRFVRSVIRVFVVFNIELPPGQVITLQSIIMIWSDLIWSDFAILWFDLWFDLISGQETIFIASPSPPTSHNYPTHDQM